MLICLLHKITEKVFYLQYRVSNQCQGRLHIKCVIQIIIYYTKLHTTFELNGILFIFSWTEGVKRIFAVIYCLCPFLFYTLTKQQKWKLLYHTNFDVYKLHPRKKFWRPSKLEKPIYFGSRSSNPCKDKTIIKPLLTVSSCPIAVMIV